MRVLVCLFVALAAVSASVAYAQETGRAYAVDYDRLYQVDVASRRATLIGEVGRGAPQAMADLSGLTTSPDGLVYAASDTLKGLIRINPTSGAGTLVGRFGIEQGDPSAPLDFAMAAACDGSLWLSSPVTRQLWKVNAGTGAARLVGGLGAGIVGLAVDHERLYGIGGRGEEGWYAINTGTGRATLIGGVGSMVDYITSASPAITAEGEVLAVLNYVPLPGGQVPPEWSDLVRIDRASGATRMLGPVTGPADLRGIGIRGFTLGPPACAAPPPVVPPPGVPQAAVGAPTLGEWSRLLLILGVLAAGVLVARAPRQRRPSS